MRSTGRCSAINPEMKPNALITVLGDDLLARFRDTPLLDECAPCTTVLWSRTVVHDDVFIVMHDGWKSAQPSRASPSRTDARSSRRTKDLVIGSGKNAVKYEFDLIPPALVVARYFAAEQAASMRFAAAANSSARGLLDERATKNAGGIEGLLAEAAAAIGKVTKALVDKRVKAVKREISRTAAATRKNNQALETTATLFEADATAKKAFKGAPRRSWTERRFEEYGGSRPRDEDEDARARRQVARDGLRHASRPKQRR